MNGDDPAFPIAQEQFPYPGLSKRELFAAMAMQGLLANHIITEFTASQTPDAIPESIAEMAADNADALIEFLSK